MSDFTDLRQALRDFAAERNWNQVDSPKNLAMALGGEAGELLAVFQWLSEEASRKPDAATLREAMDEIADVQIYLIRLADKLNIDLAAAVRQKMQKNAIKYPAAQ